MKIGIKSTLALLPRLIVFGLALLNFVWFWRASNLFTGLTCFACPWYFDWSYTNEPSFLLLAAIFLLIGKWWSNLVPCALSFYVLARAAYLINSFGWSEYLESLVKQWETAQGNRTEILENYEVQFILAALVFSLSVFYLLQEMFHKNFSKRRFL